MKRIVGATAIPDRSPHPRGRRLLRGRGSLSDLAVTGRQTPIGTPPTNPHSISSGEADYVMISQRLSKVVLMGGPAAELGRGRGLAAAPSTNRGTGEIGHSTTCSL